MAPIPSLPTFPSDRPFSSSRLNSRTSSARVRRDLVAISRRNGALSPLEVGNALRIRNKTPAKSADYNPGGWSVNPSTINNNAAFAFFGILGAALVVASIWFFFWAKNGGFRFRKGDWQEYKSTVLRRKGVDGKTLSNATKATDLGGGSIVADSNRDGSVTYEDEKAIRVKFGRKKKKEKAENISDPDFRAYRHEKPARVGGLNREADGFYHEYSNTDRSETSASFQQQRNTRKEKSKEKGPTKKSSRDRNFSYVPGTESTFSVYSDDSHRPIRSSPNHNRYSVNSTPASSPSKSRQSSPSKTPRASTTRGSALHQQTSRSHRTSVPGSRYTEPLDFETRYTASEAETDLQSRGTKAYFHPIPGLSAKGPVSGNGFRRGGGRRRDSLSDSEGETGTVLS